MVTSRRRACMGGLSHSNKLAMPFNRPLLLLAMGQIQRDPLRSGRRCQSVQSEKLIATENITHLSLPVVLLLHCKCQLVSAADCSTMVLLTDLNCLGPHRLLQFLEGAALDLADALAGDAVLLR